MTYTVRSSNKYTVLAPGAPTRTLPLSTKYRVTTGAGAVAPGDADAIFD
jgi:hypothetical protein